MSPLNIINENSITKIKDGSYLELFRSLKFVGNEIYIPAPKTSNYYLVYPVVSSIDLSLLKKTYHKTSESFNYTIESNIVTYFGGFNKIKEILGITIDKKERTQKRIKTTKPKALLKKKNLGKLSKSKNSLKLQHTELKLPSVHNVAIYFHLLPDQLIALLASEYNFDFKQKTILTQQEYEIINKVYQPSLSKYFNRASSKIEWNNFSTSRIYPNKEQLIDGVELLITLKVDYFKIPIESIYFSSLPPLTTFFSDKQAITLCSKMCSSYARKISSDYSKSKTRHFEPQLRYELHYIANESLKAFGGKILSYIYSLPSMPFKYGKSEVSNISEIIPDFPMVRFKDPGGDIYMTFYLKKTKAFYQPDVRLFKHRDKKAFIPIASIDRDGRLLTKLSSYKPKLDLIFSRNENGSIDVFSGITLGYCSICGRSLTSPNSLRMAVGPICARSIDLDPYVYYWITDPIEM